MEKYMTRYQKAKLIELVTEMAQCQNMPSTYYEDWPWPKTTPVTALKLVRAAAEKAENQCKDWATRLSEVIK
jgi:hypothetical protein